MHFRCPPDVHVCHCIMSSLKLVLQAVHAGVSYKAKHTKEYCHIFVSCNPLILTLGYSTYTAGLNAEGITGRVLLILTVVIFLVVWVSSLVCFAALTYDAHKRFSKHLLLVVWHDQKTPL